MYLTKRTYVKNWDYMKPKQRYKVTVLKGGKPTHIKPERVSYITEVLGYWRKANAIHNWFVKNVQNGDDDCREYVVSEVELKDLLDRVTEILAKVKMVKGKIQNGKSYKDGKFVPIMEDGEYIKDPAIAEELLPTTQGFFFGSTHYDENYISDLKETKKIIKRAIKEAETGTILYSSSW